MNDIDKFIAGFERFHTKYFRDEPGLFAQLGHGQQPRTLVICCCDSRVDPAMLTGAEPGDLFVVRNVGNLVPSYVLHQDEAPGVRSAIEFAVKSLEVQHIIVLGHSSCGGIKALMDGEGVTAHDYEFIGPWVAIAQSARDTVLRTLPDAPAPAQARACEHEAILVSLENLMSFPWIRERVDAGAVTLHGWYFDIDSGDLLGYSRESKSFRPFT